jgi:hypothetical protein
MIVIRTAEEMARALDSPLDPEIKQVLQKQRDILAEYEGFPLEELAEFVVVQPGDTLADLEAGSEMKLVEFEGGQATFALGAERIEQHGTFFEVLWILSDDGFGVLLFVPRGEGVDPVLLAACEHELRTKGGAPAAERH